MQTLINTKRLILRTLRAQEAPEVLKYYRTNKDHFRYSMPSFDADFFSVEYHRSLMEDQQRLMEEGRNLKLWIFHRHGGSELIGDISFSNIVRGALQSCFVGYKIGRDFTGNGYMTEALEQAVAYAFDDMKLHRIEANIVPTNGPSIRVVEKLGFIQEGYSPAYLKINGRWEGHVRFALINPADL